MGGTPIAALSLEMSEGGLTHDKTVGESAAMVV